MRTIQHPSKLQLLESQYSRKPSPWPKLVLAAVLLAVMVWNITVIVGRYDAGEPEENEASLEAGAPAGSEGPAPASDELSEAVLREQERSPEDLHFVSAAPGDAGPSGAPQPSTEVSLAPGSASREVTPFSLAGFAAPVAALPSPAPKGSTRAQTITTPTEGRALAHRVVAGTIKPGQTVAAAIMEAGLTGEQAHKVISALTGIFDFRRSRPGEGFRVKLGPEGRVELFDYERSPLESYLVHRKDGELFGLRRELEVEREVIRVEGVIHHSLFGAVEAAGGNVALAQALTDVLAWDVDFYRDTQRGDRFAMVVERFHHRGRHVRYGDILAAEYEGFVGHVRLFRYERENGETAYYDEEGHSAQKAFLRAPLRVVRVTSRFGMRRHPILGYNRAHRGVDYGAPTGTPVLAVGNGTVRRAGRAGAYGNLVMITHANGYSTWYAHLSRIHVRVGQRVQQKDVIGRVGSTGMSTGPHLHYEIRRHGSHINPLTLELPPSEPLPAGEVSDFLVAIEPVRALLDGVELLAAAPGVIPPP